MYELLKKYGYRSFMAPDKEDGSGEGGEGDNKGGSDDKGGGEGGEKKDPPSRISQADGLLGTRKKPEDDKSGEGDGDKNKPVDDGRPKGISDKFWDPAKKAVKVEDLAKSYAELEAAHGKLKRDKGINQDVPETPEEYFKDGIELPPEVDRLALQGPDDPGLKAFAKVAHKYGIGKDSAAGIVKDMMKEMNANAEAPIDPEQERAALGEGAEELIDGVYLWLEGQEKSGKFGERDINVAIDLSRTADGIRFLSKFRSAAGEAPIPLGLPSGARGLSQEEWSTQYREAVRTKNYAEQERLDAMSDKIFGDEAASGSPIRGIPNQKDIARADRK